jgi:hypothetical protein
MADGAPLRDVGADVNEPRTPGVPPSPADFAGQLKAFTDRLMAGWSAAAGTAAPGAPSLPSLPTMPATMSANQIQALVDDLAARRAQVQALTTQLEAFDEQLGTLEASVRPFLEWTRAWADAEKAMTEFWRPPSGASGT